MDSAGPYALAARHVTRRFPEVLANDDVTFELRWGEVHALLGENGSGKTTLCKLLTGLSRPDSGDIFVNGQPVSFSAPRHAAKHGIFMVQQHFSLVERFTVAENLALGHPGTRRCGGRRHALERSAGEAADKFDIAVNPRAYVWQLGVGEKQRVELLKALYRGARIIILDEPTTVLTPDECDRLFVTLRALARNGAALVFVSHKLREVLALCDRVTVLRAGRKITTTELASSSMDAHQLAELMVGRPVATTRGGRRRTRAGKPVLNVSGLSADSDLGGTAVHDVSLAVRAHQILGVAGVAGNGQRELVEAITGLRQRVSGTVSLSGREVPSGSTAATAAAGLAYVPEERMGTGLAPGMKVLENIALKAYRSGDLVRGPFLRRHAMETRALEFIGRFDVKGQPDSIVSHLSGGNAQKVLLARELSSRARVLIAAGPTRGLDIAATTTVRNLLRSAADEGLGVLLVSEDLDEILELADDIAVVYKGRIVGNLTRDAATATRIGALMSGISGTE